MADMPYGMQTAGDTQLSSIMRAINDDSEKRHAVEKRLSRNFADGRLGKSINEAILAEGVRHVKDDTFLLVNPRHQVQNEYPFLSLLWQSSLTRMPLTIFSQKTANVALSHPFSFIRSDVLVACSE